MRLVRRNLKPAEFGKLLHGACDFILYLQRIEISADQAFAVCYDRQEDIGSDRGCRTPPTPAPAVGRLDIYPTGAEVVFLHLGLS
jgi:hypothetical protein